MSVGLSQHIDSGGNTEPGSYPRCAFVYTYVYVGPACHRADYTAHEGRWETTNRHYFVDLPAEKRMVKPEYYNTAVDRTHHIHAALAHEAADDSMAAGLQGGPCGRAGARGECHEWYIAHQYTAAHM